MSAKISVKEFFNKPQQLFKLVEIKEGSFETGHRSAQLNVIKQCNVCGEQKEERGTSTNFLKCLRCRTVYDLANDERIEPSDPKELAARDKGMLKGPKVFVKVGKNHVVKTPELPAGESRRSSKRVLDVDYSDDDDEEVVNHGKKSNKKVVKKDVDESEDDEDVEVEVKNKPTKTLKDFAHEGIASLIKEAGEKTVKEAPSMRKDRPRAKVETVGDDGDIILGDNELNDGDNSDLLITKKSRKPLDISKSTAIEEKDLPKVVEEKLKVVRLKPGQTFMHEGILFIAE